MIQGAGRQAVLIAVVAAAIHLGALSGGFVFDDHQIIESNPLVTRPGHVAGILGSHYWHPIRPAGYLYRPLTILSFRLDHVIGGGGPFMFHLTSVILHAGVSALALLALRHGWGAAGATLPAGAALLFATHPVHVEAVAGIAGRADLLAMLFVLAAWLLHMRGRRFLSAAAALLALLSKESAIVLPAILVLGDVLLAGRTGRPRTLRDLAPRYLPVLLAVAVYLALRLAVVGALGAGDLSLIHPMDNPLARAATATRIATAFAVIPRQALLLVFPLRLSADYSYDQIPLVRDPADPLFLAGLTLVAAGLLASWRYRDRPFGPAFPVLFTLAGIAPVSNLLVPIGTVLAERTLYLPSLGACAGLALAAHGMVRRLGGRPALALALTAAVASMFALRTVVRVPAWKDDVALFSSAARSSPRSAKASYNLGMEHLEAGDAAAALPWLQRAADNARGLPAGRADMMRDLATAMSRLGRHEEAIAILERARYLEPSHTGVLINLGNAYGTRGDAERAMECYDAALRLQPGHAGARMNRAHLLLRLGRTAEAIAELERATRDAPGMAEAHFSLADAYLAAGRAGDAIRSLRRTLEVAGPEQQAIAQRARERLARLGASN